MVVPLASKRTSLMNGNCYWKILRFTFLGLKNTVNYI